MKIDMKEQNKYYTPPIRDVSVGMVNYRKSNHPQYSKDGYAPYKIFDIDHLKGIEDSEGFTFKHLDIEDIESLGFLYLESGEIKMFINKEKRLIIEPKFTERIDRGIIIKRKTFGSNYNVLFNGKIKNKSELKIILKQIGI